MSSEAKIIFNYEGKDISIHNNTIINTEIKYNNGDRFVGQIINNKREGKGILYLNDGDRYEGDWKNGKREGKGIYYYNDGDREMGDWKDDKKKGKHVKFCENGEVKIENY